jgi:hormone-sensitive lipase
MPRIRIFQGTNDPLHDDSIRFLEKLHLLKKDVKLIEYPDFPHGFINFDAP